MFTRNVVDSLFRNCLSFSSSEDFISQSVLKISFFFAFGPVFKFSHLFLFPFAHMQKETNGYDKMIEKRKSFSFFWIKRGKLCSNTFFSVFIASFSSMPISFVTVFNLIVLLCESSTLLLLLFLFSTLYSTVIFSVFKQSEMCPFRNGLLCGSESKIYSHIFFLSNINLKLFYSLECVITCDDE